MRKKIFKIILIIILSLLSVSIFVLFFNKKEAVVNKTIEETLLAALPVKADRTEELDITEGATYGELMAQAGISYEIQTAIYEAAKDLYDLVKIRCGRCLELVYDKDTDELKELIYQIDSEEKLYIQKENVEKENNSATTTEEANGEYTWVAEIKLIEYEVKIKTSAGTVESSMYQAALDNDIDERAIIELANAFQWTIDFAMDPRAGDTFKFVYEERYLDNEYVMPGKILAGRYVNDGEEYSLYYFEEDEDNKGYFDQDGNSVQKMFLKAPVAFKYISSGFTTGARYIEAFNISTGHRAIDYAAPAGTPIRAVGDGTVTFAGWNSQGYGRLTSIHHNGTYSTNYAHQSKIAVKYGQKVKQGDIIGYVGSTGLSTGAHLHYEMVKNGVKVNPLCEVLPPGQPIKEENKERFFAEIKKYQEMLGD